MSDVSIISPGPQGPPPYRPVVTWAPFDPDAPVTFRKAPYASVVEVDGSLYECLVTHQPGGDFAVDLAAGRWRLLVSAQLTPEWQAVVDATVDAANEANATALAAVDATASNAQLTAADRSQTGLDRAQTAADRLQTGLDRVAALTSAEAAATAASLAASKARPYATLAEATAIIGTLTSRVDTVEIFADGANNGTYFKDGSAATVLTKMSDGTVSANTATLKARGVTIPGFGNAGIAALTSGDSASGAPVTGFVEPSGRQRFLIPLAPEDMPPGLARDVVRPIYEVPLIRTTEDGLRVQSLVSNDGRIIIPAEPAIVIPPIPEPTPQEPPYSFGSDYLVTRDRFWSQWIDPLMPEDQHGNYWQGALGRVLPGQAAFGRILVGRSLNGDLMTTTAIGFIKASSYGKTDDHDAPAILLDLRTGAPYPLMVFQTDHAQTNKVRWWRSPTLDPAGLVEQTSITTAGPATYQQLLRNPTNPDEIWMLLRHTSGSADGLWSIYSSPDNGGTWTPRNTLLGVTGGGMYAAWVPSSDGNVWLMCYGHPTNGLDKVIRVAKLKWTGELVGLDGTVISANLLAVSSPVNPFTAAGFTVAHDPGSDLTRFFSMWELSGALHVIFAKFPTATSSLVGNYCRAVVNTTTGVSTLTTITACGGKLEAASPTPSYIAGAVVIDENTVFSTRWMQTYSEAVVSKFNGSAWTDTVFDKVALRKLMRPMQSIAQRWDGTKIVYSRGRWLSYLKGRGAYGGYYDFGTFNADAITLDVNTFL